MDAEFRMDAKVLESAIAKDRASGRVPVAVVATAGTTAVTSVDPLPALADVCRREFGVPSRIANVEQRVKA